MVWAVVVLVVLVAIATVMNRFSGSPKDWPLEQRRPLSVVEQKLYWRLVQSLPGYAVLAQVQLSRMMAVKRVPKARSWLNRIDRKSADFVICNKDFSVAAVIELDDSTHEAPTRRKADADKDAALKAAGIPVIRWNVKSMPDAQAIQQAITGLQKSV